MAIAVLATIPVFLLYLIFQRGCAAASGWVGSRADCRGSEDFDARVMPGARQPRIARDEGSGERFRQRHIGGVVGRHGMAQCPDPSEQHGVPVSLERQVSESLERFVSAGLGERARRRVTSERLSDLEVEQVGGVERFAPREEPLGDPGRRRGVEQDLE